MFDDIYTFSFVPKDEGDMLRENEVDMCAYVKSSAAIKVVSIKNFARYQSQLTRFVSYMRNISSKVTFIFSKAN